MKRITVELDTKVKFAFKGEDTDGAFLEITEPTGRIAGLVGTLKGQIGEATKTAISVLNSNSISADSSEDEESTPLEIGEAGFAMLTMGGGNMSIVMETLKEILKETSLINGEGRFTSPTFDRMSYSDVEKTLKLYIGNFMIAS